MTYSFKWSRSKWIVVYDPPPSIGMPSEKRGFETFREAMTYWHNTYTQDAHIEGPSGHIYHPWDYVDLYKELCGLR